MIILILEFVLLITAMVLITQYLQCDDWEIGLHVPTVSSVPFELGIFHKAYTWDNGDREQEVRIGFIFFVISFSFFRNDT